MQNFENFLRCCGFFLVPSSLLWSILNAILVFFSEAFIEASIEQSLVKSVRIRSYSGPHFPAFGLNPEI